MVDDTEDVRELYADCLAYFGFDVLVACDGQEAVSVTFTQMPAVIVMDLHMPVMDGFTATRILKNDARTRAVPIIVVTGASIPDPHRAAADIGWDELLQKPCTPDSLVAAIQRVLHNRELSQR